ncbi:MAG: hypothetical protein ACT4P1_15580 [Sporichthyaceae bacterium]
MHLPDTADLPPAGRHALHRRRLTIGLTALALVAGGGVAIAAADADPSANPSHAGTSTSATDPAGDKVANSRGGRGVLHGEFVAADGEGGFLTRVMQVGAIESVDTGALTVTSEDGYTRTYARTADTVVAGGTWTMGRDADGNTTATKEAPDLTVGQQVHVLGTLDGDEATAHRIMPRPADGESAPGRPGPGGMLGKRADGRGGDATAGKPLRGHPGRMFDGHRGPGGVPGERFQFRGPGVEPAPADPSSTTPAAPEAATPGALFIPSSAV